MENKYQYLDTLLTELMKAENQGKKGVFRINEVVSDDTVDYIKSYFKDLLKYKLDFRKCKQCSDKWDLLIFIEV